MLERIDSERLRCDNFGSWSTTTKIDRDSCHPHHPSLDPTPCTTTFDPLIPARRHHSIPSRQVFFPPQFFLPPRFPLPALLIPVNLCTETDAPTHLLIDFWDPPCPVVTHRNPS